MDQNGSDASACLSDAASTRSIMYCVDKHNTVATLLVVGCLSSIVSLLQTGFPLVCITKVTFWHCVSHQDRRAVVCIGPSRTDKAKDFALSTPRRYKTPPCRQLAKLVWTQK